MIDSPSLILLFPCRNTLRSATSQLPLLETNNLCKMKRHSISLMFLSVCVAACNNPQKPVQKESAVVIYDRAWSRESAVYDAAHIIESCPSQIAEICKSNAEKQEDQFYLAFSTAFQLDPNCSGILLVSLGGVEDNQTRSSKALGKVPISERWILYVSFSPEKEKQRWSILSHSASGEDDAPSMARSVCQILNGKSGKVL